MSRKSKIQIGLGLGEDSPRPPKRVMQTRLKNYFRAERSVAQMEQSIKLLGMGKGLFTPLLKRVAEASQGAYTGTEAREAVASGDLLHWLADRDIYIPDRPSGLVKVWEARNFTLTTLEEMLEEAGITRSTKYKHVTRVQDDLIRAFGQQLGLMPSTQRGYFGTYGPNELLVKYAEEMRYIKSRVANLHNRLGGFKEDE